LKPKPDVEGGVYRRGGSALECCAGAEHRLLFVGNALTELRATGVSVVWSADCVPHTGNAMGIVPLLAQALRQS
jgi:hypothetical protein